MFFVMLGNENLPSKAKKPGLFRERTVHVLNNSEMQRGSSNNEFTQSINSI